MQAPLAGTIERWCWDLVVGDRLDTKLEPPAPPDPLAEASWESDAPARRLARPGRPSSLQVVERAPRPPRVLDSPEARARLLHTFAHHELQAAELFAWAVLAYPRTPRAFRSGLVRLCLEELAHLDAYRRRLAALGCSFGDLPVRDWFWERVPTAQAPENFAALMGLGLEAANLEHTARFAEAFRRAGDDESARLLERVEREEIAHVAFGRTWFERFTRAPLAYEAWRDALPRPLSPSVLQGRPLNRRARLEAGMSEAFLDHLAGEPASTQASTR